MQSKQNFEKASPPQYTAAETLSKYKMPKKIASIHDISCIGRCAQTVVLPILAAMGAEPCPLPTALLSTHTGGYTGFTFLDLTDEMERIIKHWDSLSEKFDAVYSGFLGSEHQIEIVEKFVEHSKEKNPECIFLADPVMGDDGTKYATYTDTMCALTKKLVTIADIITPNITEACILLDIPYKSDFSDSEISDMLHGLCQMGAKISMITGIHRFGEVGAAFYEKATHKEASYFTKKDPNNYPGAGDIFSSIVLSSILSGLPTFESMKKACDFISKASMVTTSFGTPVREGLAFEAIISDLII